MTQKELEQKYMQIIKTQVYPHNEEMQEYSRKKCGYIIELSDGKIIGLDKPRENVPEDLDEIIDRISRLKGCLDGIYKCKTFVEYYDSPDNCDLVKEVIFSADCGELKWMKEKESRGQNRSADDIKKIIYGCRYLTMEYAATYKKLVDQKLAGGAKSESN